MCVTISMSMSAHTDSSKLLGELQLTFICFVVGHGKRKRFYFIIVCFVELYALFLSVCHISNTLPQSVYIGHMYYAVLHTV